MSDLLDQAKQAVIEYGPRVFWAVLLAVALYLLSWILAATIRRFGQRIDVHQVVVDLISQLVSTTLLIIGLICVLGTLGVNISALVAGLGLAGFALGFALKDVLSNVLSGILLLYYRPFWLEDRVKVSGHEGTVTDIDLRYTSLETDNSTVLLPNSVLFTNSVEILAKKSKAEAKQALSARSAEQQQENSQPSGG